MASLNPAANDLDLLAGYGEILSLSRRMHEAAQNGDWDSLIELEQVRAESSSALLVREQYNKRAGSQSAKADLIRSILASDEETRRLVVPRQQELRSTFASIDTERKLQKAYAIAW